MVKSYRSFEMEGQRFEFPDELSLVAQEIAESDYIPKMKKGWDDGKAVPVEKEVWLVAAKFLANYAQFIFNQFSVAIAPPDINPCPNGSIDLSWRTNKARMLINIRKEGNELLAFYYGDLYDNKMPIKGNVPAGTVEGHLAYWMKNLV